MKPIIQKRCGGCGSILTLSRRRGGLCRACVVRHQAERTKWEQQLLAHEDVLTLAKTLEAKGLAIHVLHGPDGLLIEGSLLLAPDRARAFGWKGAALGMEADKTQPHGVRVLKQNSTLTPYPLPDDGLATALVAMLWVKP